MGLFRRKQETLNEQLLREAGLDPNVPAAAASEPEPEPEPETSEPDSDFQGASPLFDDGTGVGLRAQSWYLRQAGQMDAVVTVRAAALLGDRIDFTTLPDGDIIVESEKGDGDLAPLANAIEEKVEPPYRAFASRHDNAVWAVGAKRIQVAQVELAKGDTIELTANRGEREVRVDDELADVDVPELVELGEEVGPDYCVEAERIDGDFWEVHVSPL